MKKERRRELLRLFRDYKRNKRELDNNYNIPVPSGIAYDKVRVTGDKTKNVTEIMTLEYISKRDDLFKRVHIVEEVLRWFELEGHGRDRFITVRMMSGVSFTQSEYICHASIRTMLRWQDEILDKTETVCGWWGY